MPRTIPIILELYGGELVHVIAPRNTQIMVRDYDALTAQGLSLEEAAQVSAVPFEGQLTVI